MGAQQNLEAAPLPRDAHGDRFDPEALARSWVWEGSDLNVIARG
jgi:hypothetical protein